MYVSVVHVDFLSLRSSFSLISIQSNNGIAPLTKKNTLKLIHIKIAMFACKHATCEIHMYSECTMIADEMTDRPKGMDNFCKKKANLFILKYISTHGKDSCF